MNVSLNLADSGKQTLDATRAIVLYNNQETACATIHEVATTEGQGCPVLLAGALLTRDALDKIVQQLAGAPNAQRRLLPKNALCVDKDFMAWHVPARRLPIFFNTGDKAFNKEMEGATVLHPPLLFAAKPRVLSVWALSSDTRPEGDTPVYRAPYYNLYEGGNMCAGTVSLPQEPTVTELAVWEQAFYETNFTHSNYSGKLTWHKDGHNGLWREMAKKQRKVPEVFSFGALVSVEGLTVGKVVTG